MAMKNKAFAPLIVFLTALPCTAAPSVIVSSFAFHQTAGTEFMATGNLLLSAIPEASAVLLGGLALLALFRRRY
jgi:hypothetical protein